MKDRDPSIGSVSLAVGDAVIVAPRHDDAVEGPCTGLLSRLIQTGFRQGRQSSRIETLSFSLSGAALTRRLTEVARRCCEFVPYEDARKA
jgi:hypothetical protein